MAAIITYVTLDHSALDRGIVQANAKLGTFTKNIERQGMNLEQQMIQQTQRAAMRLAAYGSLFAAGAFLQQIVKVRGEFQQLGIAFETMLDSKEKSDRIMAESITLAQKTPFTLMEVTSNAKQLMAMGVSFEKVMGTIKNLGDVAAGVSVPLSRIAINYGQVLTLGRLQMREIRDFAMAGVPLIGELSKNLGKSTAEITKMVSAGKIGFKDVEEAFRTMSAEGGKFYNLMEKQNKSVTGQISNLVDKWQVMLNEIGKGNEGVIYGGIKGVGVLLSNYKEIGNTLIDLVLIYGSYKAAIISISAAQAAMSAIQGAKMAQLYINEAAALSTLVPVEKAAAIAKQGLVVGTIEHAMAVNAEIVAEKIRLNSISTLAAKDLSTSLAKIAAIDAEIIALRAQQTQYFALNATHAGSISTKQLDTIAQKISTKSKEYNSLVTTAQTQTLVANNAAQVANTYSTTANTLSKKVNVVWTNYLSAAMLRLNEIIYANPYTIAAIAITGIVYSMYKMATAATHAEAAAASLKETLDGVGKRSTDAKTEMDSLVGTLTSGTSSVLEQVKAWDKLISKYQFLSNYSLDDILKMSAKERDALFSGILEGATKDDLWKQYQTQIDRIKKLEGFGIELPKDKSLWSGGKISAWTPMDAWLGGDQKMVDAEYAILNGIQDKIKETNRLEQEANIQKMTQAQKLVFYSGEELRLTKKKTDLEKEMSTSPSRKLQGQISDIDKQIKATKSKLLTFQEAEIVKNEQYWKNIKETAEKALSEMTPSDAGFQAQKDIIANAERELEKWKNKQLDSDQNIENNKQRLIEQRSKNELFAATVLQGKLLKVEEETTNQKLAIAANELQKNLAQVEKNKLDTLQALKKKGEAWSVEDEATYQQAINASNEVFLAAKVEINRQAAEEIDRIWQEVEDYRLTGYEKEIATLNKKFREEEKQLRKLYSDKAEFAKAQLLLDDFYNKKRQDLETNYAIESIDLQIELGYKKNEATIKGLDKENRLASANYETWRKFTLRKVDLLRLKTDEASKRELALTEADLAVGAEKRKAEQIAQIGQYAGQAADAVLYLSETLSELADKTGNEKLKAFAEEIGAVGKVIQSAAEGAKSSGSWIGAIIGAATSMITQTIDSIATAKAEIYEYQQNQIDFLRAYQGLLLEVKKEDYETVFGISTFAMVAQATKNAKDALQKYNEELAKDSGAPVLKKQQEFINEYKTLLDAYKKGYTDLQGMAVKTKDYTGWATIWGKRDEYKSLIEIAPQLWGADGVFSVENAKKFLETNTQISDAQRKTIQNVIDLKDAYDQNMAIIKEDIKDTFGDIGEAATDSIVDAIVNGTKAFKIFEDAGASAIENLGEKLMYELFFANRFKKLQDDLLATYDLGDPQSIADAQLNLIDQFYGNIGTDMENAQKWGEQWKEKAKEKGFDIWSPEKDKKSSGLTGQIERAITESTGQELAGLWRRQFDDTRVIRDYTKIGITHLSKIEVNTYNTVVEIQKSNEELKKIVKNTTTAYTGVL